MKKLILSILVTLSVGFIIQGFQCSSKEMLDAKTQYERKEYEKAIVNLEKELAKNNKNDEARLYLVRIRMEQGDLREAAKILMDAEKNATNPKYKDQFPKYKNKMWVESYNKGITYYNEYFSTQNSSKLDSADYYFEIGSILRPTLLDFYFLRGNCLQLKGDTLASMQQYAHYVDGMSEDIKYAFDNKFYINQDINEVKSELALDSKVRIDTINENTIQRIGESNGKYFYSKLNKETDKFELKGWRTSFPADWLENEKLTFVEFRIDVFFLLSEYYYNHSDYENALKYLETYQKIDPLNNKSNSSIIQIYKEMGKEDVAIQKLEALTKDSPDNPLYWTMLGDMFASLKEFDKAISNYEAAIKVDGNYDYALRNIASTYKNKAVSIQDEEQKLKEKDPKYNVNVEKYLPFIEKSSEYFERARKTDTFKNDYVLFMELANNYIVLGKTKNENFRSVLNDIERIEFKVEEEKKNDFYLKWLKIASDIKDNARVTYISNKIKQLGN